MSRVQSLWRNGAGYYDPTAGAALSNIMREENKKERRKRRRRKAGTQHYAARRPDGYCSNVHHQNGENLQLNNDSGTKEESE